MNNEIKAGSKPLAEIESLIDEILQYSNGKPENFKINGEWMVNRLNQLLKKPKEEK